LRDSTIAVHAHEFYDEKYGVFIPPIFLTTIFEQRGETLLTDRGTELKYSREENPTVRCLERVLATLEHGADSLAFNSGMSAISATLIHLLKGNMKLLVPIEVYGSTLQLVQALESKLGVKNVISWPETQDIVQNIIEERPDVVFVESITNPTLRVIDVVEAAKACREVECSLIVDNTFATPLLVNPLKLGSRYVIHSLTKYLGGHNDVVGGVVVAKDAKDVTEPRNGLSLWDWRRILGGIMQPFEAYLTLRGVKTLEPRFLKACSSAREIAEFLSEHPKVERVYYPGLASSPYKSTADRIFKVKAYGAVVSFTVKEGRQHAIRVLKRLRLIRPSPSLGGAESLMTYPVISASKSIPETVRVKLGITDSLLRLSVGLEDVQDLIEDLDRALK